MATNHALNKTKVGYPQSLLRQTGIYAIGVGLMVTSAAFTHEMNKYGMGLLLKDLHTMGPLGDIWRNWANVGLYCVGFMSYAASCWDYNRSKKPINDVLRINTFVFGTTGLVNLVRFFCPYFKLFAHMHVTANYLTLVDTFWFQHLLMRKRDHALDLLWMHVILCGIAAVASFAAIDKDDEE